MIDRTVYWHGGRVPLDGVLRPQSVMRSGEPGNGWVYVTTERDLAATYASTLPGSWLMKVQPVGAVERDPESMLTTSFRCSEAVVLSRYTLSNDERQQRAAAVGLNLN